MCGPTPRGFGGSAADRADSGMPRKCLPSPHGLKPFQLLVSHECFPRFVSPYLDCNHSPHDNVVLTRLLQKQAWPALLACAGCSAASASRCTCRDAHCLVDPCQHKPSPNDVHWHGEACQRSWTCELLFRLPLWNKINMASSDSIKIQEAYILDPKLYRRDPHV